MGTFNKLRRAKEQKYRQRRQQRGRQRRLNVEGLEERRLLAGDSIVFVDPTVWDNDTLPTELTTSADEVVVLDPDSDGIQQIADYLTGRTEVAAIHLISHGAVGEVAPVGNAIISSDNLAEYSSQLATIGSSLSDDGDILLWGCEVAGTDGVDFVQSIASMTGADVAASDDTTGSPSLGGDWDLEYTTGPIEASNILAAFDPQITLFHTSFFRISDASAVSEGNTAFFTISRTGSTNFSSTVGYFTSSNSATTSDYVPESATLSFPAGVTARTVTITTRPDSIDELTESFFVRLRRTASNGLISDPTGVGTIIDATPTARVFINNVSVSEGNTATFTLTKDRQSSFATTVQYSTSPGSASTADFVSESGTVTFSPFQTSQTITIATREDSIDELSESFFVNLFSASGMIIGDSQGAGTITDDDPAARVFINNVSTTEGGVAVFQVSKDRPSSFTTSVQYATAPNSATPADFVGESGTVVFSANQTAAVITVQTTEDQLDEPTESFLVNLFSASGMSIADSQGIGSIIDDDNAPVADAGGPYAINEGDSLTLNASLSTDADGDPLTYRWDVDGDGDFDENINGATPTISHAQLVALGLGDGPYSGGVRVEASDGTNTDTATTTLTVNNVAPTVTAVIDSGPVAEGSAVAVTALATDPVDSLLYEFDFDNNGTFEVGPQSSNTSSHVYADNGNYRVNVRVTDGDGGVVVRPTIVTVNNRSPIASAGSDQTVDEGDTVTLTGSFSDVGVDDGHLQEWSVVASNGQMVDGQITNNLGGDSNGVGGSTFSFVPEDNGTYTVIYSVRDDDGGLDIDSATITVNNVAPELDNVAITPQIDENQLATLSGDIFDPGTADTFELVVNWGDGSPNETVSISAGSASFSVQHQYRDDGPSPGNGTASDDYTATIVSFSDDDGGAFDVDESYTLNAVNRGWWGSNGAHSSFNNNTFTGYISSLDHNSYFSFNTSGASAGEALVLRLELEAWFSNDGTETISVYDVQTDAATLENANGSVAIYSDLQTGNVYGSATIQVSDVGSIIEIPLSSQAVADFNASPGSFSVGVSLDSRNFSGFNEGVRFSGGSELRTHQLQVEGFVHPVITVDNVAPYDFEAGLDATLLPPVEGLFTRSGLTFTDPGTLDVHTVTVNYGDGTGNQTINVPLGDRSFDLAHTYTTEGAFTVTVSVADDDLGVVSDTFNVTVDLNNPPTAADGLVSTLEDTLYVFSAGDFNFSDPDVGDTLAAVEITTLPNAGTLLLDTNGGSLTDAVVVSALDVIDAADIDAGYLLFQPATHESGTPYDSFGFRVSDGEEFSIDSYLMTVRVIAVADAPTLAVANATGTEDSDIPLDVTATLVDQDGSETLSLEISGVPVGATLSDGTFIFTGTAGSDTVDITTWNLASLTITPPLHSDGEFDLTVTARATELSNSSTADTVATVAVQVDAVADAPTLAVNNSVMTNEDAPVNLGISSALVDTDGSESLTLAVEGVPAGAILSDGSNTVTSDGSSIDITGWSLGDITVQAPQHSDSEFELTVTATSTESAPTSDDTTVAISSADTVATIAVVVDAVADAPSLSVNNSVTTNEDTPVNLGISSGLVDTDGSESLTLAVAGAPDGAVLTDGVNTETSDGVTPIDITGWSLGDITVQAPQHSDSEFELTVTATSTESAPTSDDTTVAISSADTVATIAVVVDAVADAPSLSVNGTASGVETSPIPLDILSSLVDTDASETLLIYLSGLPSIASLNQGTDNGGGNWTLLPSELAGLEITVADDAAFTINVTATATEEFPTSSDLTVAVLDASSAAIIDVTVENVAPTLVLDSVSAIFENGVATLTGTITDPGTLDTFTLDINWGDPLSPDNVEQYTFSASATGSQTFTLTHPYLDDNPTGTPLDSYTITATVTDDDTGTGSDTQTVIVENVAPVVDAGSNQTVNESVAGMPTVLTTVSILSTFTDVGTRDTHTATIDWGDSTGVVPGTLTQGAGSGSVAGSHQYADDGVYTVTVTVTDDDGGIHSDTLTVTVLNVAPAVTVDNPNQADGDGEQYSDSISTITFTANDIATDPLSASVAYSTDGGATYTAGLPDDGTVAGGLVFSGSDDQSSPATWTIDGVADLAPGTYTFRITVSDDDGGTTQLATSLTAAQEDAVVTYSGSTFVSTPSVNNDEATVELRATIQDVTAAFPAGADLEAGNITTATVSFIDNSNPSSPVVIASGLPITLLDPLDPTAGVASYSWIVDIGNSDSTTFDVVIQVDDYYTGSELELITVSKPLNNAVTGGGYIINESSDGQYAGDDGRRTNFGFNIKTNKKGTNVQGHVNLIIRQDDRIFQVKTNATNSLVALPGSDPDVSHAEFIAKANLKDITDPLNPISLGGNLQLIARVTDAGEPGDMDSVEFTVWDGSILLFSTNWTGTQATEQLLDGGNIQVRLPKPENLLLEAAPATANVDATPLDMSTLLLAASQTSELLEHSLHGAHDSRHLGEIDLRITDLPGSTLGANYNNVVWIDSNAAGYGWDLYGDGGGVDLLSVIAHEYGHALGFDHDVMDSHLGVGARDLDWLDSDIHDDHDQESSLAWTRFDHFGNERDKRNVLKERDSDSVARSGLDAQAVDWLLGEQLEESEEAKRRWKSKSKDNSSDDAQKEIFALIAEEGLPVDWQ